MVNLVGAVALLLWGMRMVRTGVTRAYGSNLRHLLGEHLGNRLAAFFAGLGVTALLQSSTATCLMTASFASRSLVATGAALAIMLGADVGTSLVAQVFSFDIRWFSPVLITAGAVAYSVGKTHRVHELGRVGIGLGLMLLALQLIIADADAIRESSLTLSIVEALQGEPLLAVLFGALLAWLAYSSLATVLLVASLVGAGAVPMPLAFALILGANLGAGMPAILATLGSAPPARRVAWGNAIFKALGVVVLLPLLGPAGDLIARLDADPIRQAVNFHTAFNLALAAAFLFATDGMARLLDRLIPDRRGGDDAFAPRYLDPAAQGEPALALACAARETLRMGDTLDAMLRGVMEVLKGDEPAMLERVSRMDDRVDLLHEAIKLYLTDIRRQPLDEEESQRWTDIMSFTTNLEHIGDIIDKNLLELAAKKMKHQFAFSEEGLQEIEALHQRVQDNLQLAMNTFVSGERNLARRLLSQKDLFRELEREAAENHHKRLRQGKRKSIETSSMHLDIVRDLKRINSHLTSVAYPILDKAGELRKSRLKEPAATETGAAAPDAAGDSGKPDPAAP